jgi:hypothetical protein
MRIVLVVALALVAVPASSEIYKWVDENGVTHYTQTPPQSQEAEKVGVSSTRSSSGSRAIPKEAQDAAEGLAQAIVSSSEQASDLDCRAAVANGHDSIDTMLEVGRKNAKDGYVPQEKYDETAKLLRQVRRSVSVSECNSSKGSVRDFYLCLSNPASHIVGCGEKYNYEP